jgi:lysophospholipase L1-like esterase
MSQNSQDASYRIAVLGDSSSSDIGASKVCYARVLFTELQLQSTVSLSNFAVPGFTSADAARFFADHVARSEWDYLVIYLGNNEGAIAEHKGRYSPIFCTLKSLFRRSEAPVFSPVLTSQPLKFLKDPPAARVATSHIDFANNLTTLIKTSKRNGICPILINPRANPFFPSGLGAPNSSYFCYVGNVPLGFNKLNNQAVDEASDLLAKGLQAYAEGRENTAIELWSKVGRDEKLASFIAEHNIASVHAKNGDARFKEKLTHLTGSYPAYDGIVLHNLSCCESAGVQADRLRDAYEADISLYRVKSPYRRVVAELGSKYKVPVLDLKDILTDDNFIDYCHPTAEGHRKISDALFAIISSNSELSRKRTGPGESRYEITLPSPNYAFSPGQDIIDYYCIDWPISRGAINAALEYANASGPNDKCDRTLQECIKNFFARNSEHPIFKPISHEGECAPRSNEILSFPEFYIYRFLVAYLEIFESEALFGPDTRNKLRFGDFVYSSASYRRMILSRYEQAPEININLRMDFCIEIIRKLHALISLSKVFQITIAERTRTLPRWYTREAFKYGTHSRLSMLYWIGDLDKIIESIIVASVICHANGQRSAIDLLEKAMNLSCDLRKSHEGYVSQRAPLQSEDFMHNYQFDLDRHRDKLRDLLKQLLIVVTD